MLDKTKTISTIDLLRFILDDELPNSYAVLDEKMLEETIPKTFELVEIILSNLSDLAYDFSDKTVEGLPNKCLVSCRVGIEDLIKRHLANMNKYQLENMRQYLLFM